MNSVNKFIVKRYCLTEEYLTSSVSIMAIIKELDYIKCCFAVHSDRIQPHESVHVFSILHGAFYFR